MADTGDLTGKPQGSVPGDRIDRAVELGLDAFWQAVADAFPEATGGDMGPGDADPLDTGAAHAVRVWIMWNVPDGMPEYTAADDEDDREIAPCPVCGHRAHRPGGQSGGGCSAIIDNGWTWHGCHCTGEATSA